MNNIIRQVTALVFLIGSMVVAPIHAEDSAEYATKPNRGLNAVQHKQLDVLFDSLKKSTSEIEAFGHEQEIWRIWTTPENQALSQLMTIAFSQIESKAYISSIKTLDNIVERFPKYAEGWNQRAIVHYQLKNFDKSLEDIERALKLEPRHFGAYSGRSMIYFSRGENSLATKDILKGMRYHPYLRSRDLLLQIPHETDEDISFI
mgnify:FL=1